MKTYSTSQIAKIVGVHPNTVRLYEEWGLLQIPERKANGYRVFTDMHIEQFRLTQKALAIPVLQAGLRKKIISAIKHSARYEFDEAVLCVREYLETAARERENAIRAAESVTVIMSDVMISHKNVAFGDDMCAEVAICTCENRLLNRSEAAKALGITIDTLRNWEMNGLLTVRRKENGYRVYDSSDMRKLRIIRSLRCANYSLASILKMLTAWEAGKEQADILKELNTPVDGETIVSACDKLIASLDEASENAKGVLQILLNMKEKYKKNNPPV